jgi:hypothetical protein
MPNPNPNMSGLRPCKPGEVRNPKGRPTSRVPKALKIILGKKKSKQFYKLNELEINDWENAVLTMTTNELKVLAGWEDANSYAKGLAISILFDMKNGKTNTLDKLRERQFGKAIQKVELTGANGKSLFKTFDPTRQPEDVQRELLEITEKLDLSDGI